MDQRSETVDQALPSASTETIEPEGAGHIEDDEPTYREQQRDPKGELGPSYEREQVVHGRDRTDGGSSSPNSDLSHADSRE